MMNFVGDLMVGLESLSDSHDVSIAIPPNSINANDNIFFIFLSTLIVY